MTQRLTRSLAPHLDPPVFVFVCVYVDCFVLTCTYCRVLCRGRIFGLQEEERELVVLQEEERELVVLQEEERELVVLQEEE